MEMRAGFFHTFMEVVGDYVDGKQEQTQLLGRLTVSLLEQSAVVASSDEE